jgi:hypothetical protein
MDMSQYGPFASIIAITAALFSVFSFLLLKAVGPLHHSHVITIRGDSYRLKEKRRSGLLQKTAMADALYDSRPGNVLRSVLGPKCDDDVG